MQMENYKSCFLVLLGCWIAQEKIVNYQWRLIKQYGVYWYVIALLIGGGYSLCMVHLIQEMGRYALI